MTPTEIETIARSQYNATNDTFFSQSEILSYMWQACQILAREAKCIERVYSTTTVANQQSYSFPSNTLIINRITYNGTKLKRITMRQDDSITLMNAASSTTGTSSYYFVFNETIYLRPIPDAAYTLQIFSFNKPQQITATSDIEVPDIHHMDLVDYVVACMAAKDQNFDAANYYRNIWNGHVLEARRIAARRKRGDSFATVENEDILPVTILGET